MEGVDREAFVFCILVACISSTVAPAPEDQTSGVTGTERCRGRHLGQKFRGHALVLSQPGPVKALSAPKQAASAAEIP